jgi:hypothetical protein
MTRNQGEREVYRYGSPAGQTERPLFGLGYVGYEQAATRGR